MSGRWVGGGDETYRSEEQVEVYNKSKAQLSRYLAATAKPKQQQLNE